MDLESVTLRLTPDLLSGAKAVAAAQEVTLGHVVRDLLRREVMRHARGTDQNASHERLVLALQTLLETDFATAEHWSDLIGRLAVQGFELLPEGYALALHRMDCGTRLCTTSDLGFPHGPLARRFGREIPGHPVPMAQIIRAGCPEDTDALSPIGGSAH